MSLAIDHHPTSRTPRETAGDESPKRPGEASPPASGRLRSLALAPLKACWNLLTPLRRPVLSRVDQHIARVLRADLNVLSDQFNQFAVQTAQAQQQSLLAMREMNIFIDGLLREMAQLQEQIQTLSLTCSQLAAAAEQEPDLEAAREADRTGRGCGREAALLQAAFERQQLRT